MTRFFILAGEASGDRIGARLISGIRQRLPNSTFEGVGGEAMAEQGLNSFFPMDDLAVMGYRDVILRLPLLLWRARQTVHNILRTKPDIVVLIDAQVFAKVVAQRLRRRGFSNPIVLYVAPAVWAWGADRAPGLARIFDEVLSVLPFEPTAMRTLGGPETAYVGHPATNHFPMRAAQPETGPLLLFAGSRSGEIRRHLPMFASLAENLWGHPSITEFVLPTPRSQQARVERETRNWKVPVRIVATDAARTAALEDAVAAVAVSGTVTLELALAGVPHLLTYVAEGAQVRMYEKATTRHIGLPNIIAGAEIVPEVLFAHRGEVERLEKAARTLLDEAPARDSQLAGFSKVRELMEKGAPEAPLEDPVDRILRLLPATSAG